MIDNTLDNYNLFRKQVDNKQSLKLSGFVKNNWKFTVQTYESDKELNQALKKLHLTEGWITLPEKNIRLQDYDYNNYPLFGQACCDNLSVQFIAADCHWQLTIIEANTGDNWGLVCVDTQLDIDKHSGRLCFESFWQEIDGAMRKTASRFTGVK